MLKKSRKLYKHNTYFTRTKLSSFAHKTSKHSLTARKLYAIDTLTPTKEFAQKTGCTLAALRQIVRKGEGAYYSSGSRPNQTARSWGLARLASSVTGGKAASVDFDILAKGCDHTKTAYRLALTSRKKHKHGQSHTRRIRV